MMAYNSTDADLYVTYTADNNTYAKMHTPKIHEVPGYMHLLHHLSPHKMYIVGGLMMLVVLICFIGLFVLRLFWTERRMQHYPALFEPPIIQIARRHLYANEKAKSELVDEDEDELFFNPNSALLTGYTKTLETINEKDEL